MHPHVHVVSFNVHFTAHVQHFHPRLIQTFYLNNQDLICYQKKAAARWCAASSWSEAKLVLTAAEIKKKTAGGSLREERHLSTFG